MFAGIGCVDEGFARLEAAEKLVAKRRRAEADEQLMKALASSHPLGATRYIRQAEALLSAAVERPSDSL